MPMIETTIMIVTILWRAAGSTGRRGSEKRMNPYVPIFNKTPARITDPAVGASVCASGSQVWNGNIGTLIANAKKKARNTHHWRSYGTASFWNSVTSKVYTPVSVWL